MAPKSQRCLLQPSQKVDMRTKPGKDILVPRRRTEKACDACRRRKMKCDGKVKCATCTTTGLVCTYGIRVKQIRGERYIAHLERKVEELQQPSAKTSTAPPSPVSQLSSSTKDDTSLDTASFAGAGDDIATSNEEDKDNDPSSATSVDSSTPILHLAVKKDNSSTLTLETIAADQRMFHELDSTVPAYRGNVSGIEVLRRIYRNCIPIQSSRADMDYTEYFASALDKTFSPHTISAHVAGNILPPLGFAELSRLINIALSKAFQFRPFLDRALLMSRTEVFFNPNAAPLGREELALLYALLALGKRHDIAPDTSHSGSGQTSSTRCREYFSIAQRLVCHAGYSRSLTSVQTIMCLVIYLITAFMKSEAHSYVSIACQAAHQLGLHQPLSNQSAYTNHAMERAWTYIVLKDLDTYLTVSLGIPPVLHSTRGLMGPTGSSNLGSYQELAAANAYFGLLEIVRGAVSAYHQGEHMCTERGTYRVAYTWLRDFDEKLNKWSQSHPLVLDKDLCPSEHNRLQLCYYSCWARLTIYTPFVHHALFLESGSNEHVRAAILSASQTALQAVDLAELLVLRDPLDAGDPLTIETLAMAAMTLLCFQIGHGGSATSMQIEQSSDKAYSLLQDLSFRDGGTAERCVEALSVLRRCRTADIEPTYFAQPSPLRAKEISFSGFIDSSPFRQLDGTFLDPRVLDFHAVS